MNWRSLFGIDLAGSLRTYRRRYNGRLFDHKNIWCHVTEWNGKTWSVSASARYCDGTWVGPLDNSMALRFFQVSLFQSRIEAEAYLEREIRRAAKKHPATRFHRLRTCLMLDPGELEQTTIEIDEFCQGGVWQCGDKVSLPFAIKMGSGPKRGIVVDLINKPELGEHGALTQAKPVIAAASRSSSG